MLKKLPICLLAATALAAAQTAHLPAHSKVLFQGDSITDMNRGRTDDPNHILGHSYVFLIAARTASTYPQANLQFINRGISGNKVSDLADRWQSDTIDLHPTILSLLIGVNDVDSDEPIEKFESDLDALLARTHRDLPTTRLVLCEPFMLPTGWREPQWAKYEPRLKAVQAATRKLATKYHAILVPLQEVFDKATQKAPADFWIWDSIHPTYAGQQLIADQWVRIVNRQMGR